MYKFFTLSFSGAGHLLAYHLGVASAFSSPRVLPHVKAVSGSSSGAITAVVLSFLPHRLSEYADRFLQDRGYALRNLKQMLLEEEGKQSSLSAPEVYVCVTKSDDGLPKLLNFHPSRKADPRLIKAVEASCRIPQSFHPFDMLMSTSTYEGEGIEIDGSLYVDGGISAPFPPPCPHELGTTSTNDYQRILVSPVELKSRSDNKHEHYIFPSSYKSNSWYIHTRGDIKIQASLGNLRALLAAGGFISGESLKSWYERGLENGQYFVDQSLKVER